jgi:Histone deacetylase domain
MQIRLLTIALTMPTVSAGFDAARGDDLGDCDVTPGGYAHMTHMLSSLAGGKVVVALEVCAINLKTAGYS